MGKNTESTKTTYEMSPEQRQIMQSVMNTYMPGGQLPTSSPEFDYNSSPELQQSGQNYTAPFSTPTQQAFAATEANFGAQQPTMNMAKGLTMAGAAPAGQFQGAPDGWSTGANGEAQYQDYETGINKYMSPFVGGVINTGLDFLNTARQRQNLDTDNNSVVKGSFGGTRQAVRRSLDDQGYAAQAQKLITDNLNTGYNNAQGQYNTGFTQGQQALGYNTGVAQGNRAAVSGAGAQLGQQAMQNQQLTGNEINALGNVGSQIEAKDQAQRDAARAAQLQSETWGLNIAQAAAGFTPPPSSTTTKSVPSSSIWGTAAAAGANMGAAAMLSDERAKTNVEDAKPEDALAEIRKLKPKRFEYTGFAQKELGAPAGRRTGFMAQDLEKATGERNPEVGHGMQGVDIGAHVGRLTAAVAALDAKLRDIGKRKAA